MISWNKPNIVSSTSKWFPWLILCNVTYNNFAVVVSAVTGFIADSTVRGSLMLSADDMRWISISFIMMLGMMLPVAVWAGARFGYKRTFFIGTILYIVGSILNSFSLGFTSFMISRMIAGAGGGVLFPLAIIILDQTFPKQTLSLAISFYIGIAIGIGTVGGYFLGGYFCQYFTWQSAFLLAGLIEIPVVFLTWLFHEETPLDKEAVFDRGGYASFVLFVTCLLLVLNNGKADWNAGGWTSPFILWSGFFSLVGLALLILIELKHPKPMLPLDLFKKKSFILGCIAIAFIGAATYTTQLYFVEYFNSNLNYDLHTTALSLVPMSLTLGITSALVGILTKKIDIRILTLSGMVLLSGSLLLNQEITIYTDPTALNGLLIVRALGMGLSLGPATALAISEVPVALAGAASLLIVFFRQVGGTLGSVGSGAIIIERTIFHRIRFGTQMNPLSPRFQEVAGRLQDYLMVQHGMRPEEAWEQAISLIKQNIVTQSQATALADTLYLFGLVMCVVTALFALQIAAEYRKKRKQV